MNLGTEWSTWVCAIGCCAALSCSPPPTGETRVSPPGPQLTDHVQTLAPAAARTWLKNHPDALVIDAREESEFRDHGRLPNAVNLSQLAGESVLQKLKNEPAARPMFIYCALGARAESMAASLDQMGFQNLHVLQGGLHAWKDAGLATIP